MNITTVGVDLAKEIRKSCSAKNDHNNAEAIAIAPAACCWNLVIHWHGAACNCQSRCALKHAEKENDIKSPTKKQPRDVGGVDREVFIEGLGGILRSHRTADNQLIEPGSRIVFARERPIW